MLLISAGNIHDMSMAQALIDAAAGRFDWLIADKGYDSNAIRAAVMAQGSRHPLNHPPTCAVSATSVSDG